MRTRRWAVLIGLGAVLLAVVPAGVLPQTAGQFRSTVESSVQDALPSVGAARLAGRTTLRDNTFSPYESTVLEDARKSVATAIPDVAELDVPSQDTRRLRDETLPLPQESARLIGDLGTGLEDGDGVAVTLGILTAIGGFVDIGDLVANSDTGARFGIRLAWVVVVGVVGIRVYAEMSGRVAAVSGRPVFDLVREHLGPRGGGGACWGSNGFPACCTAEPAKWPGRTSAGRRVPNGRGGSPRPTSPRCAA